MVTFVYLEFVPVFEPRLNGGEIQEILTLETLDYNHKTITKTSRP